MDPPPSSALSLFILVQYSTGMGLLDRYRGIRIHYSTTVPGTRIALLVLYCKTVRVQAKYVPGKLYPYSYEFKYRTSTVAQ